MKYKKKRGNAQNTHTYYQKYLHSIQYLLLTVKICEIVKNTFQRKIQLCCYIKNTIKILSKCLLTLIHDIEP